MIAPTGSSTQHMHPGTGADGAGSSSVNGVQQRGVGAVELDQRPRERAVQRLALQGAGCQVQDTTVPTLATGTISVSRSYVTGSYSAGGTCTRPSEPRTPTMRRSRRAVKNWPRTGSD